MAWAFYSDLFGLSLHRVNLNIKGLSKREATSIYLISVRIATQNVPIQAETQRVFQLGDTDSGIYEKGKGDN